MDTAEKNHLFLTGISHKTADVETRERVSFTPKILNGVLDRIYALDGITECVVLSTCNRTEIYTVTNLDPDDTQSIIENELIGMTGLDCSLLSCFYHKNGSDVISHLFRVACGLDSMILGEPQIFGQIKEAYATSCDHGTTGAVLNRLFHHAFRVGKMVRNSTSIGEGAVSVSFAAVEMLLSELGSLDDRTVLLVGAGKTGTLCARRLVKLGVGELYVTNRTVERARDLTDDVDGIPVPLDRIPEMAATVDIIITSVAACNPIIHREDIENKVRERTGRRLILIDLGVPRNISSSVSELDDVSLFNIDDLDRVIWGNKDRRREAAEEAEALIRVEVDEYRNWLTERKVIPLIKTLRQNLEKIRTSELENVKNRVNGETYEILDMVSRRIVRKILHNPIITMRSAASGKSQEHLIETMNRLFNNDNT